MTLEQWKNRTLARINGATDYLDEQTYGILVRQALKQDVRMKWYLRISGLLLIFFIIMSARAGNYTKMFLFICTLHLHIIMVYRYKNIIGKPQWEIPKDDAKKEVLNDTGR